MTTLEELRQVVDLFERMPSHQEPAGSFIVEFSWPLLENEDAGSMGLWIDVGVEDAGAKVLEASPEFLAGLLADPGDRVN